MFHLSFSWLGTCFCLPLFSYLLQRKRDIYYWGLIFYVIISIFLNAGPYRWGWLLGGVLAQNLIQINILRIAFLAFAEKKKEAL